MPIAPAVMNVACSFPRKRIFRGACALLFLVSSWGCAASSEEDAFARTFIEHLRTRNPAGATQLEPDSEISEAGWESVARQSANLPTVPPDSVVLWETASLRDEHGRARKLTYHVYAGHRYSIVELWIVKAAARRYVNTVRITGPIQGAGAKAMD